VSDKQDYDFLCPKGFKEQDGHLIHLNNQSNAIGIELAKCCIAHPPLMRRVRELADMNKL